MVTTSISPVLQKVDFADIYGRQLCETPFELAKIIYYESVKKMPGKNGSKFNVFPGHVIIPQLCFSNPIVYSETLVTRCIVLTTTKCEKCFALFSGRNDFLFAGKKFSSIFISLQGNVENNQKSQ